MIEEIKLITTPSFKKYISEHIHIGRLITYYSEIEISLYNIIKLTKKSNENILKIMIRDQNAFRKIEKAKEIGLDKFTKYGLNEEFIYCIKIIHHCRKIRNLYAHSNYWDANWEHLMLMEINEVAKIEDNCDDLGIAKTYPITNSLLLEQLNFYNYTLSYIFWLNNEIRYKTGMISENKISKPLECLEPKLKENEVNLSEI